MKRHRVRSRPKVRRHRRSLAGVAAALGALLLAGSAVVRAKPWARLRMPAIGPVSLPAVARVDKVEVSGAPAPLEQRLRESLGFTPGDRWGPRAPSRASARLAGQFPCLRQVAWHRSYLKRRVRFDVALRSPVATVSAEGSPVGFMDATGRVFEAPQGVFDGAGLPRVELDRRPEAALEDLGRFVAETSAPGALPAKLVRLRPLGGAEGWAATLENGTELVWGSLDRTGQKLGRLREVMADAGPRFGSVSSADLRYFNDGKILVRPR